MYHKAAMKYLFSLFVAVITPIVCIAQQCADCESAKGSFVVEDNYQALNEFSSHKEAETHYFHSRLNTINHQKNFAALRQISDVRKAVCEGLFVSELIDLLFDCASYGTERCPEISASRGELLKGRSESSGCKNPVLLMPKEFQNADVTVVDFADRPVFSVARESCCSNGDRQHFFFKEACENAKDRGPIKFLFNFPGTRKYDCRMYSGDSCSRSDGDTSKLCK